MSGARRGSPQPAGLCPATRLRETMVERSYTLGDPYRMTGSLSVYSLLLEQRVEFDSRAVDEDERAESIAAPSMRRSLKTRDLRPRIRPPAASAEPHAVGSRYQPAGVVAV